MLTVSQHVIMTAFIVTREEVSCLCFLSAGTLTLDARAKCFWAHLARDRAGHLCPSCLCLTF